ncbi:MAG TPA: hypothetical protein VD996_02030 [Chitinophagaceae bacterium]|nr:hypothetical protein [Chitinophagaceae bacterium]
MKNYLIRVLFAGCVFTACNNNASQKGPAQTNNDTAIVLRKAIDLQPEMRTADSMQVLFYTNPDGDPKRYTRFFTYVSTADTAFIQPVIKSLQQSFDDLEQVRDCRSEGKLHLFKKGTDNPLQTLYFSSRCDTCCYVYYIRNGRFVYVPLTNELAEELKKLKKQAKKI